MMGCGSTGCGCVALRNNKKINGYPEEESTTSASEGEPVRPQSQPARQPKLKSQGGFFHHLFRRCRKREPMSKIERTMKAAILIQRWYRRYLARMEVRRRYTWTIFQSLEYAGEQDQVKLYNFYNALLTHMPDSNMRHSESDTSSYSSAADDSRVEELDETFPSLNDTEYKGIHVTFPMKRQDVDALIDSFRRKPVHRLHPRYVAKILKESVTKLKRMPNFNQASTAISKQVTICGDLHGKLDDLLVIFHKNGLPSTENPYVFNGDFVDRGRYGFETLILLLSCMLVFPGGVFLNRGNHEDQVMNVRYGFIREMNLKFRPYSEKLMKLIENVYRWLPLGTFVNNKVLVVHGGISDSTDLDLVKSVDRGKYVSLLRPPINNKPSDVDKSEWKQVFDLLWSDPQTGDGCVPNTLRGAGTYFGPDVTKKFLKNNRLLYLVRSHECKPGGYELTHNNKVITIFSASNYYEVGSNKGAYVKLVGPQLTTHFVQFTAAITKSKRLTFRQRVGLVESSAIRELSAQILSNKAKILQEFQKMDNQNTGLISVSDWCLAMHNGTMLGLPWRMLREKLAQLDSETSFVRYVTTFESSESAEISSATGTLTVVDTLYKNKSNLEAIFRIIDKDNSGYISLEEFSDACNILSKHMPNPFTQEQMVEICRLMDINKDGLVDLNEFLETFRLVDMNLNPNASAAASPKSPKSPISPKSPTTPKFPVTPSSPRTPTSPRSPRTPTTPGADAKKIQRDAAFGFPDSPAKPANRPTKYKSPTSKKRSSAKKLSRLPNTSPTSDPTTPTTPTKPTKPTP